MGSGARLPRHPDGARGPAAEARAPGGTLRGCAPLQHGGGGLVRGEPRAGGRRGRQAVPRARRVRGARLRVSPGHGGPVRVPLEPAVNHGRGSRVRLREAGGVPDHHAHRAVHLQAGRVRESAARALQLDRARRGHLPRPAAGRQTALLPDGGDLRQPQAEAERDHRGAALPAPPQGLQGPHHLHEGQREK